MQAPGQYVVSLLQVKQKGNQKELTLIEIYLLITKYTSSAELFNLAAHHTWAEGHQPREVNPTNTATSQIQTHSLELCNAVY